LLLVELAEVAGAAEFDGVALVSGVVDAAGAAELEAEALVSGVLDVAGAAEVAAADCEALAFWSGIAEDDAEDEVLSDFWQVSEIERTPLTL
jgi:hypothetical protein